MRVNRECFVSIFDQGPTRTQPIRVRGTGVLDLCSGFRLSSVAGKCATIIAFSTLVIVSTRDADAIVINDFVGSSTAIALGTPYEAVVEVDLGFDSCTGSLITDSHILTANHCTAGLDASSITTKFHIDNDGIADLSVGVNSIFEMSPSSTGSNLLNGTDISILSLSSKINLFDPIPLATSILEGVEVTTVGFGNNGLESTGTQGTRDGLRWAANNIMDQFGDAVDASGTQTNILNTDFDDGTSENNKLGSATPLMNEGSTARGDSGGPLLWNGIIAGVLSGGSKDPASPNFAGDVSWWTGTFLDEQRAFIEASTNGKVVYVQVPLPATLMLLGSGLLIFGGFVRRKKTI